MDDEPLDAEAELRARVVAQEEVIKKLVERSVNLEKTVARIAHLIEDPTSEPRPWVWFPVTWPRALDRKEALRAWKILTSFVDELVIPLYDGNWGPVAADELRQGSVVNTCWFAHNDIVQRLSDLYWEWHGAYRTNAAPSSPPNFSSKRVEEVLLLVQTRKTCASECKRFHERIAVGEDGLKKASGVRRTAGQRSQEVLTRKDRDNFITLDIADRRDPPKP